MAIQITRLGKEVCLSDERTDMSIRFSKERDAQDAELYLKEVVQPDYRSLNYAKVQHHIGAAELGFGGQLVQ